MEKVYDSTLKPQLDKNAEITVFLSAGGRRRCPNATSFFYDRNNAVVINDKPEHKELPGTDPFQLTLAHEFVHCLGFHPYLERNHVITLEHLQSLRIPSEIVDVIAAKQR